MTEDNENIENENVAVMDEPAASNQDSDKRVPLSALQKERKKRQELEEEVNYYRSQYQEPVEETHVPQDIVTRDDINALQADTIRQFNEQSWAKDNPEKIDFLNQNLETFLKQRPHLAQAIASAPNRYEEAFTLVSSLSPQQQQQLAKESSRKSPLNPSNVPKASGVKQTMDVMDMSDDEFRAWRQSRKRR